MAPAPAVCAESVGSSGGGRPPKITTSGSGDSQGSGVGVGGGASGSGSGSDSGDGGDIYHCPQCNSVICSGVSPPPQYLWCKSCQVVFAMGDSEYKQLVKNQNQASRDEKAVGEELDMTGVTPKRIYEHLSNHVVGQERAKKTLSVAVYNHYKRITSNAKEEAEGDGSGVQFDKSNVLLLGPTGCGKTLLASTVARLLQVPFVTGDCTSMTQAGYVGDDVESVITKLVRACDNNIELAQRGIVYLDEIDKIAFSRHYSRDISGAGVQQALLKMLEGSEVTLPASRRGGRGEQSVTIDTSNILFVASGAFSDLEEFIADRQEQPSIGFGANLRDPQELGDGKLLKELEPSDLIKFGMMPEFVGRFPVVVGLEGLDEDALVGILTEPENCLVRQYTELFRMDGVSLTFTDGALARIAKEAMKKKTGARGLRSIIEPVLLDAMYEVPGADITAVIVDEDVVRGKKPAILERAPPVDGECENEAEAAAAESDESVAGNGGAAEEAVEA